MSARFGLWYKLGVIVRMHISFSLLYFPGFWCNPLRSIPVDAKLSVIILLPMFCFRPMRVVSARATRRRTTSAFRHFTSRAAGFIPDDLALILFHSSFSSNTLGPKFVLPKWVPCVFIFFLVFSVMDPNPNSFSHPVCWPKLSPSSSTLASEKHGRTSPSPKHLGIA